MKQHKSASMSRVPPTAPRSRLVLGLPVPLTLQSLTFVRSIGQGSLGKIMLAEVQSVPVAVKIMKKHPSKVRKIAEAEKHAFETLRHPLIAKYYGWLEDDTQFYLVLEHLPKGDLFRMMKRRRLRKAETRFYAMEVAAVLRYMHGKKVVYRDLKPENVMVHESGHIRMIDFGFAKKLDGERTHSSLGSPEYMPPELILKKPHDFPVDCWSFGIYEFPACIDGVCRDLIRKLLNPEAKFRWRMEDVARHEWFRDVDWTEVDRMQAEVPPAEEAGETERKEKFTTTLFDSF